MKKRSAVLLATIGILGTSAADAQTIGELMALVQRTRAVISSNASIDDSNPERFGFTTNMDGQLVELNLRASRLNDSFLTAINYAGDAKKIADFATSEITFGDMRIFLNGCDVTDALRDQCNATQCWDANPEVSRSSWSGTFGMQINLNLSALNPNALGCGSAGQTRFFDSVHTDHTLEFKESVAGQGRGGSLFYQLIIYHRNY